MAVNRINFSLAKLPFKFNNNLLIVFGIVYHFYFTFENKENFPNLFLTNTL